MSPFQAPKQAKNKTTKDWNLEQPDKEIKEGKEIPRTWTEGQKV